MKNTGRMTEGSVWKNIIVFAIPLILGNLFQQLYNTVDILIVGNYVGKEALAAVGAGSSVIFLFIGFCVGTSAGASIVLSQYFGGNHKEGVFKTVHTTVAFSMVAGVVMTVVGVLAVPFLLKKMNTPPEIFHEACLYLRIYFGGIGFSIVYNMSAGILNAVGNSRRSLRYLMISAVTNIVLDILFVVGLKMGVAGAAIATGISQLLASVLILLFLMRTEGIYRLYIKKIRFYDRLIWQIIRIGLPTGVQNTVISFANVLVQSSVNSFGSIVMAGYTSYVKIDGFNILPLLSFSMAAATFSGQNVGAGKYDRVKSGMMVSTGMGVVYSVFIGTLLYMLAPEVLGIFSRDPEVVQYGVYVSRFFCPFYWLLAILHILLGTVRGVGKTLPPMIIILLSLCIFRVTWLTVTLRIDRSMFNVFVVYPLSWFLGAILAVLYVWRGQWMPGRESRPLTDRESTCDRQ